MNVSDPGCATIKNLGVVWHKQFMDLFHLFNLFSSFYVSQKKISNKPKKTIKSNKTKKIGERNAPLVFRISGDSILGDETFEAAILGSLRMQRLKIVENSPLTIYATRHQVVLLKVTWSRSAAT